MSDQVMSRRKFLLGSGAVVGAVSLTGIALAERPTPARAAGAPVALPWPYPTDPAKQPDPAKMAGRAYEVYYDYGCAEGCWYPIIEFLAADYPDTWGTLPQRMLQFGGGGVRSWGTLCGTLNGAAAIIAMTGAPNKIVDEVFQYYSNTPLPSNGAERAVASGAWTPTPFPPATSVPSPMPNMPTSTARSPLCHASLSQWTMTSGAKLGSPEHYDRCGKATFDVEFRTITLLNAYFANGSLPAGALDPSIATCGTCHSTQALGKQACDSCHDETPTHAMP